MKAPFPIKGVTWLAEALCLAVAYWITGKLGLLLAIPPGYATPVWPPAGIALASLLLRGQRIWPGVWLGSFLVNSGTLLDASSAGAVLNPLILASGISLGAALQALAGAALLRRFVGLSNPLYREADIARFLVLGGPVSCLIGATVGVTSLWWVGQIAGANYAFSWWTWWVGDSIGALTIATLVLVWTNTPRPAWLRRQLTVSLPLCLIFFQFVILFVYASIREQEEMQGKFQRRAESLTHALQDRIVYSFEALYAVQDFQTVTPEGDRERFAAFAANFLMRRPYLQAVSWNPRVADADRVAFEETARRDAPGFYIAERDSQNRMLAAGRRPAYFPILWIEPAAGNELASGFDIGSDPARLEALMAACDTGQLTATRPVRLVHQGDGGPGILVLSPVYRSGAVSSTPDERRANLLGFAVVIYHVSHLVELALQGKERAGIYQHIIDEAAPAGQRFLFEAGFPEQSSTAPPSEVPRVPVSPHAPHWNTTLDVAGRRWQLQFTATPQFTVDHRSLQLWSILTGGLVFSIILGGLLLLVTGRTAVIEGLVAERTNELTRTNTDLQHEIAQRQRVEEALRRSLGEKEVLLRETHHRVKNNLSVIGSLFYLHSTQTEDPEIHKVLQECQDRIRSIALVHESLYRSSDLADVDFAEYARELANQLFQTYVLTPGAISLKTDLEKIGLHIERAIPCGLILNELIANALKHAFPDGRRGEIGISLHRTDNGGLILSVTDNGVGLPDEAALQATRSLGLRLVDSLTRQLDARFELIRANPGVEARLILESPDDANRS